MSGEVTLSTVLAKVDALRNKQVGVAAVPAKHISFPFDTAYPGQMSAYEKMMTCTDSCLLTSHTGSGKTAVFMTVAKNLKMPTLVIETRKFLQQQVARYDPEAVIIFGKNEYPCEHAWNAAVAPCWMQSEIPKADQWESPDRCIECRYNGPDRCPCPTFFWSGFTEKVAHKACTDCAYKQAKLRAFGALQRGGIVVCNHGNFWGFLSHAKCVVVDEADAFVRAISAGIKLDDRVHWKDDMTSVETLLTQQRTITDASLKEIEDVAVKAGWTSEGINEHHRLSIMKNRINFFMENHSMAFAYRKQTKKIQGVFVEMKPSAAEAILRQTFKKKILFVVTATPSDFPTIDNVVDYMVPQRTGIFYYPVGLMTVRNISQGRQYLLKEAAEQILDISEIFQIKYGTKKAVIHCGNLHEDYSGVVMNVLGPENCIMHTRGRLMNTLERFSSGGERFLLVVSAEHGADFHDIDLQFVLKVPFASMDERVRMLQKVMQKHEFDHWYAFDALNRLVQQCGRVGRGAGAFGCTFILDSKFDSLYNRYAQFLPGWFHTRLIR
jgi:hypothetical protein